MNLIIKPSLPRVKTNAELFAEIKTHGPMCAMEFDPLKHDTREWIDQPKLQGVRGILYKDVVYSKLGNELEGVSRLRDFWYSPDLILDGEFYIHGASQQDIVSAVKNVDSPHWPSLKFHVFDAVMYRKTQVDRLNAARACVDALNSQWITFVNWTRTKLSAEENLKYHVGNNFEGVILRHSQAWYNYGPQPTLLKLKPFLEMDVNVCDRYEGTDGAVGMLGGFYCETDDNKPVNVGGGFTLDERIKFWLCDAAEIPRRISIKYQYKSNDGIPVHPNFIKTLPSI